MHTLHNMYYVLPHNFSININMLPNSKSIHAYNNMYPVLLHNSNIDINECMTCDVYDTASQIQQKYKYVNKSKRNACTPYYVYDIVPQ